MGELVWQRRMVEPAGLVRLLAAFVIALVALLLLVHGLLEHGLRVTGYSGQVVQ